MPQAGDSVIYCVHRENILVPISWISFKQKKKKAFLCYICSVSIVYGIFIWSNTHTHTQFIPLSGYLFGACMPPFTSIIV